VTPVGWIGVAVIVLGVAAIVLVLAWLRGAP
jgi:hypothetical protein